MYCRFTPQLCHFCEKKGHSSTAHRKNQNQCIPIHLRVCCWSPVSNTVLLVTSFIRVMQPRPPGAYTAHWQRQAGSRALPAVPEPVVHVRSINKHASALPPAPHHNSAKEMQPTKPLSHSMQIAEPFNATNADRTAEPDESA